jgi:hypothetical protein
MWVSKDEVLAAAWSASPLLWLAILVAAALSAVYAGLLLGVAFAREPGAGARVGVPGFVALTALGASVVALGGLALVEQPAALWLLIVASLLAVAVVTAVAVRTAHGRLPAAKPGLRSWLAGWLDLEKAARVVVARPLIRLAEALARFDDRVVDGSVHAAARGLIRGAGWVRRRFEEPVIDGAVEGLANAARALGRLARRPQTGMLHQYYAQAVVLLFVLVVVALVVR